MSRHIIFPGAKTAEDYPAPSAMSENPYLRSYTLQRGLEEIEVDENLLPSAIHYARRKFLMAGFAEPNTLYLGMHERAAMREYVAREITVRFADFQTGQRTRFMGMDVFYVDAESHLAVTANPA